MSEIALDYYTQTDSVSLCPGRLEKAQVIEALHEAAFFIMDAPPQTPKAVPFDSMYSRETDGR
jgi:hypothetical protein